ncbi:MAG TPA: hypothetical protein VN700_13000 [Vicinamibacterales bacterium]|nr:hypothetical protein [Vicinamibacterales bacterium]
MNAMLTFGATDNAPLGPPAMLLDWIPGLAICSNCREVVSMSEDDGGMAMEMESVLLDTPCPRCGEAAMRASDGTWD